ncbi:hypothetical protein D3C87_2065760 [compost metagenome]
MLLDHLGQNGSRRVEQALYVHVHHPVPLVDLELVDVREWHQARIVDEDVD